MMENNANFTRLWKEYLKLIAPEYEELEKERIKNKRKFFIAPILLFLAIIGYFVLKNYIENVIDNIIFLEVVELIIATIAVLGVIGALFVMPYYIIAAKTVFNSSEMNRLLKVFGDRIYHQKYSLKNEASSMLNNSNLDKSELFFKYNNIRFDDVIYGSYKGVEFEAAEADMNLESDKYAIGIFKGIILAYKNNKRAKFNTIVSSKNVLLRNGFLIKVLIVLLFASSLEIIGGILKAILREGMEDLIIFAIIFIIVMFFSLLSYISNKKEGYYKTFNKITLEDPMFNKRFNVYCSDELEARCCLTPAFMERFYNLKTVFSAKNIRCCFFNDKLIIAIETKKDLFELGSLFSSVKDMNNIYQFYKEIKSIFDIIDTLKLDS